MFNAVRRDDALQSSAVGRAHCQVVCRAALQRELGCSIAAKAGKEAPCATTIALALADTTSDTAMGKVEELTA